MKASVVIGGELDIATPDEVKDAVRDGNDSLFDRLSGRQQGINPRRIVASYTVPTPGTGTFTLNFGSPNAGMMWWLTEAVIVTATDREVIAGAQAALYIGMAAGGLTGVTITGTPPLGMLARPAIATPATFIFNEKSMPVRDNEDVSAIIYSPTNAVSAVSGVITVIEVPASAVLMNRL